MRWKVMGIDRSVLVILIRSIFGENLIGNVAQVKTFQRGMNFAP